MSSASPFVSDTAWTATMLYLPLVVIVGFGVVLVAAAIYAVNQQQKINREKQRLELDQARAE